MVLIAFVVIAWRAEEVAAVPPDPDYYCLENVPCPISITFNTQDPEADSLTVAFFADPATYTFEGGTSNPPSSSPPYACTLTGSSPANGYQVVNVPPLTCTTSTAQGVGPFTATGNYRFSYPGIYVITYSVCDDAGHCSGSPPGDPTVQVAPLQFDWLSPDHDHPTATTVRWRWSQALSATSYDIYVNSVYAATVPQTSEPVVWSQALGGYNVSSGSVTVFAVLSVGVLREVESGPRTHYSQANVPGSPTCTVNSSTQITWNWTVNSNPPGTNFYASNLAGNSSWITGTQWVQSGLTPNTTYTTLIKARNNDTPAEETSTVSVGCTTTSGDTTGPTFTFNPASRTWASSNISVNLSAADPAGVSVVRYCWRSGAACDPGTGGNSPPFNCTGLSPCANDVSQGTDGSWYLCARGQDTLGNWGPPVDTLPSVANGYCKTPYQKDTAGPTTPGVPSCTPNPNNTGDHTCTWTASLDALSGLSSYYIYQSTNGGPFNIASPAQPNPPTSNSWRPSPALNAGTYRYQVVAVDVVGNASAASPISSDVIVDKTAPAVASCSPNSGTYSPSVSVTCTAGLDQGSPTTAVSVRFTQGSSTPPDPTCGSGIFSNPTIYNSTTILKVRTCDAAGNSSGVTTYTYTISGVLPISFTFTPGPSVTWSSACVSITLGVSSPNGITSARYAWDPQVASSTVGTVYTNGTVICSPAGSRTLTTWAQDGVGNTNTSSQSPYRYDNTNPSTVTFSSITPNPNNTGSHLVDWTDSTDSQSGIGGYDVYQSNSGAGGPYIYQASTAAGVSQWTAPGIAAGTYNYRIVARDNSVPARSSTSAASVDVIVDKTAPAAASCNPGNGTYSPSVSVTCTAGADSGSPQATPLTVRYTSGPTTPADPTCSSAQFSNPTVFSSTTVLKVATCDGAGNRSGVTTYTYTISGVSPITFSFDPPDSGGWQAAPTTVTLGVTSPNGITQAKYCWSTSTTSCNPQGTGTNYTDGTDVDSPPGTQYLFTWAQDGVGNTNTNGPVGPYQYDDAAPTSTITSPAAGSWYYTNFSVSVTDSDTGGSGLSTCYYSVESYNGASWVATHLTSARACNSSITITVGAAADCRNDGANTCRVAAISSDVAGNFSATAQRTFSIDRAAPTVTAFAPQTTPTKANPVLNWTASDTGGSGLARFEVWRAPDVSGSPGSWSKVSPDLTPATTTWTDNTLGGVSGRYWYGLHAVDTAGNCITESGGHCGGVGSDSLDPRAAVGPDQVLYDVTAPTPNPPTVSASGQTQTAITWTLSTGSDALVGLHATPYGFDDQSGGPYAFQNLTSWTENGLACGTSFTRYGVIRDALDNRTSQGTATSSTTACTSRSASLSGSPSISGWTTITTFTYTPTCVPQGGTTLVSCATQVSTNSGGNWSQISTSQSANQTYTLVSGSVYRFRVVETDTGGSITSTPVPSSGDIQVDTQAPTQVTLTLSNTPTNVPFNLSWTASSDPLSGLNRYELWRAPNNGGIPGTWAPVTGGDPPRENIPPGTLSVDDTPPSSGIWWYGIHAVDNVGNWSAEVTSPSGTYDTTAPVASNHNPAKGSTVTALRPELSVTVSDNLTGIGVSTITVAGGSGTVLTKNFASGTTNLTVLAGDWSGPLANDTYTVTIQSVDGVGNTLNDSSWTFTVNNAPPSQPTLQ